MNSITILRGCSHQPYVQKNMFPGQASDSNKVFLFKMLEVGFGSGMDLVKRMQSSGGLESAQNIFGSMKQVKKWMTMTCHIYDSTYCHVMTITVCDMQSKDAAAQSVLQKNLNAVLARHGISESKFKGFMVDCAQTNQNVVQVVYESGDVAIPMKDKERICLFHYTQWL